MGATREQRDPPSSDLRSILSSSSCMSVIFSELVLKMDFIDYVGRVKAVLQDLELNSFDMSEMLSLQAIIKGMRQSW